MAIVPVSGSRRHNMEKQTGHPASTPRPTVGDALRIQETLERIHEKIAPVWPLQDYVAVNPYQGMARNKFLSTREQLRRVSDLELLMPVPYYRQAFRDGSLCKADIDQAVDEMVADGVDGAERIDVTQITTLLRTPPGPAITADAAFQSSQNPNRQWQTISEMLGEKAGIRWTDVVMEEVSRHCASHYDQGQAIWSAPWQHLPLYLAWRNTALHDRNFEILSEASVRSLVTTLPLDSSAALILLLRELNVPTELWDDFLLCQALAMPGWSAWTRYQHRLQTETGQQNTDFAGLLAMRLTYEVALARRFQLFVDWPVSWTAKQQSSASEQGHDDESLLRYALLKAAEIAYRRQLIPRVTGAVSATDVDSSGERSLAQMVFCIDVRSERIRRQLENTSQQIQTYGFAGFFGLPIEFVGWGDSDGSARVPVLISPQWKVHETLNSLDPAKQKRRKSRNHTFRFLQKAWKEFQTSAVSAFAFVETAGWLYGPRLVARALRLTAANSDQPSGLSASERSQLTLSLEQIEQDGLDLDKQADLAESILRGIGIVKDFGRLVVFCGHGSQMENNPLKAGFDCGACGGHSGEPNARLAAMLLNRSSIRQQLENRGISIPSDTHFVAALHNTTTDEIQFFDRDAVPNSHSEDLATLFSLTQTATVQTRSERAPLLSGASTENIASRCCDWSEIRPEWGLAGNAAFVVGPRQWTRAQSLQGRSFLHSYDHHNDPEFRVLEQIMTAPLIVANWINLQYYASTVDPVHLGSGNKTVHNVVGQFGILSGNGGDLMTGLPWQSVHDGRNYHHHPLRLLAVIAAPRQAISAIIAKHESLRNLITNGWMQLIAVEAGQSYRYSEKSHWESCSSEPAPHPAHSSTTDPMAPVSGKVS